MKKSIVLAVIACLWSMSIGAMEYKPLNRVSSFKAAIDKIKPGLISNERAVYWMKLYQLGAAMRQVISFLEEDLLGTCPPEEFNSMQDEIEALKAETVALDNLIVDEASPQQNSSSRVLASSST